MPARRAASVDAGRCGRGGRWRDGLRPGAASELLRLPGRCRRRSPRSRTTPARCSCSRSIRSAWACSSGRAICGADIAVAEGQSLGTPMLVRRAVPGHHGLPRAVRPPDAGPDRRADGRSPRPALLGADAANPRAAHPPREGDEQHLHEPGAVRAAGRDLPGRDGAARPARGGRAVPAEGALRRASRLSRSSRLRARVRPADVQGVRRPRLARTRGRAAGRSPRCRLSRRRAAGPVVSRSSPDCFLVAVTEKRTKAEIDGLGRSPVRPPRIVSASAARDVWRGVSARIDA